MLGVETFMFDAEVLRVRVRVTDFFEIGDKGVHVYTCISVGGDSRCMI
jgi:hypothetical protein